MNYIFSSHVPSDTLLYVYTEKGGLNHEPSIIHILFTDNKVVIHQEGRVRRLTVKLTSNL